MIIFLMFRNDKKVGYSDQPFYYPSSFFVFLYFNRSNKEIFNRSKINIKNVKNNT